MKLLLLLLLASGARAEPPFHLRSLEDQSDVAAVNENFRSVVNEASKLRSEVEAISSYQLVFGSTEPSHNTSIAATDYVGVATMTMLGARGGRTIQYTVHLNVENDAGASRDYTYLVMFNGVAAESAFTFTNSGNSTGLISEPFRGTSVAGTNKVIVNVLSSNAAGTQTAKNVKIHATEF